MAIQTIRNVRRVASVSIAWLVIVVCGVAFGQNDVRYLVNYTSNPPVIDGTTTADEWRDAAPSVDQWVLLGSTDNSEFDDTNNGFSAVWDEQGLYIQHKVTYGEWDERGKTLYDSEYETLEFHFDPNGDGESNAQGEATDSGTDAYSLFFNQPFGKSELNRTTKTSGVFADAQANGGAVGIWSGFASVEMQQTTSIEDGFGYTELFLPWHDFNATNPLFGFSEELGDDIGLFHPDPPTPGDEWYFNIGRRETSGRRPAWTVSSPEATSLSTRPHGVLEFMQSGGEIRMCDINRDGECSAADIDELTDAILAGSADGKYDLNADGAIDLTDRRTWVEHGDYMHTYLGDSNLDGEFSTRDFVDVFQAAEYEDKITMNSGWAEGDWNGDKEFSTTDFVEAFQTAAYEKGPRQAIGAAVPEPSGITMMLGAAALMGRYTRRNSERE